MSLTRVVEEQGVVWLSILNQPMHRSENICLGRLAHRVLLVIGEKHHVFSGVAKVLVQVRGHVLNVVDTTSQLTLLAKVVDADQQGLSFSRTF